MQQSTPPHHVSVYDPYCVKSKSHKVPKIKRERVSLISFETLFLTLFAKMLLIVLLLANLF